MHASEGSAALSPVDGEFKQSNFLSVTHAATVVRIVVRSRGQHRGRGRYPSKSLYLRRSKNFFDKCATRPTSHSADVFALVKDDRVLKIAHLLRHVFCELFFTKSASLFRVSLAKVASIVSLFCSSKEVGNYANRWLLLLTYRALLEIFAQQPVC